MSLRIAYRSAESSRAVLAAEEGRQPAVGAPRVCGLESLVFFLLPPPPFL